MVCRRVRDDAEMIRAGRDNGTWYLGRGPGRGLWWCDAECSKGLRVGHLARALRAGASESDLEAVRALESGRGWH
ncbi:MAG TPA: hypothetical protein VNT80_04035 [Acidimicrobiales bacterium]|nr:hypothetical protein [Acidimicrobiales bacterium]